MSWGLCLVFAFVFCLRRGKDAGAGVGTVIFWVCTDARACRSGRSLVAVVEEAMRSFSRPGQADCVAALVRAGAPPQ